MAKIIGDGPTEVVRSPEGGIPGIDRLPEFANRYGAGLVVYTATGIISALVEWLRFAVSLSSATPLVAAINGFLVATNVSFVLSRRFVFISIVVDIQRLETATCRPIR